MFIIDVFGGILLSTCFGKYFRNKTERTLNMTGQCIDLLSVWYAYFIYFEDSIDICLGFVVWNFKVKGPIFRTNV